MSLPINYRQTAITASPATPAAQRIARPSMGSAKDSSASPFSTPQHGNPAFAPQKLGGNTSSASKSLAAQNDARGVPKPPKGPDKPLMPYMRYSRKVWDQVKAANQDLKLWEIGKIIGGMWRDLPETEKQLFVDEYEAEKVDYHKNLESFHQSQAYVQYMAAKAKAAATPTTAKEEPEAALPTPAPPTPTKMDRRIDIQPAEDDEEYDDSMTLKHVSHARYVRNHRLINEVFSDTMVPDVRSVVTGQRLAVLRRQVQSLTMHQKKLETELTQIEEKFEAKKRKFLDAGESFQLELKNVKSAAPKMDEAFFAGLVEREKESLRKESDDRQKQLTPQPDSEANRSSASPQPSEQPQPAQQNHDHQTLQSPMQNSGNLLSLTRN